MTDPRITVIADGAEHALTDHHDIGAELAERLGADVGDVIVDEARASGTGAWLTVRIFAPVTGTVQSDPVTPEEVARLPEVPMDMTAKPAHLTFVLNPHDAAALEDAIGPLPGGAFVVSQPLPPRRKVCPCALNEFCDLCDYRRWMRVNGLDRDALLHVREVAHDDRS